MLQTRSQGVGAWTQGVGAWTQGVGAQTQGVGAWTQGVGVRWIEMGRHPKFLTQVPPHFNSHTRKNQLAQGTLNLDECLTISGKN